MPSPYRLAHLVALPALAGVLAAPQDASPLEIRRELERLRLENQVLEAENDALRASVSDLQAELVELRDQIRNTPTPTPTSPADRPADATQTPGSSPTGGQGRMPATGAPAGGTDPSTSPSSLPADPLTAPAAMLAHLKAEYEREFARLPRATPRQRSDYTDRLKGWIADMNSEVRGQPTWLIRLSPPQQIAPRRYESMIVILDPETLVPIGEPFLADLPGPVAERLSDDRFAAWRVNVLFAASPTYDADRPTPGPIDYPPLIGAFVEFGYALDWRGIEGVAPEDFRPTSPTAPTPTSAGG